MFMGKTKMIGTIIMIIGIIIEAITLLWSTYYLLGIIIFLIGLLIDDYRSYKLINLQHRILLTNYLEEEIEEMIEYGGFRV